MDVRRVVTGHDADGKAVFVGEEQVGLLAVLICGAHHDKVG